MCDGDVWIGGRGFGVGVVLGELFGDGVVVGGGECDCVDDGG